MPFAGLDVHKQEIEAVVLDDSGRVRLRRRLATEQKPLEEFARKHLADCQVALEATTNCWAIATILQPLCREVVVSNPLKTRAIAESNIKTDRIDARALAELLRCNYLPRVWTPDAETRQMRQRSTERANLSADRTRVKNRLHAVLHQRLIPPPMDDLFGKRGRAWLNELPLDAEGAATVARLLRALALVEEQISELDQSLAESAYQQPRIKLLMTLPGVDVTVAQTLAAALGDVNRFASGDRAAAYLGLAPSTRQSGNHCYHGRITKQGASHARWLLVQAAQQVARHPGPLGVFFRRLAQRKNRNVAVVATARKLVTIAWHMLKNNEPYRYAQPKTVEAKLSRLRIRATGNRKKNGSAKGKARPSSYGSGVRTRAVPSLDQIYGSEQLPSLSELSSGEKAMLKRNGIDDYANAIRKANRIPRRSQ